MRVVEMTIFNVFPSVFFWDLLRPGFSLCAWNPPKSRLLVDRRALRYVVLPYGSNIKVYLPFAKWLPGFSVPSGAGTERFEAFLSLIHLMTFTQSKQRSLTIITIIIEKDYVYDKQI